MDRLTFSVPVSALLGREEDDANRRQAVLLGPLPNLEQLTILGGSLLGQLHKGHSDYFFSFGLPMSADCQRPDIRSSYVRRGQLKASSTGFSNFKV